jgi:hypothetical protein
MYRLILNALDDIDHHSNAVKSEGPENIMAAVGKTQGDQ